MTNQDDVAACLVRVPIEEMHKLMAKYEADGPVCAWGTFVKHEQTIALLVSHGWTLKAYAAECMLYNGQIQSAFKRYA